MVLPSQYLHDPSLVTPYNAEKDPKFCMIFYIITVLLNCSRNEHIIRLGRLD